MMLNQILTGYGYSCNQKASPTAGLRFGWNTYLALFLQSEFKKMINGSSQLLALSCKVQPLLANTAVTQ